MILFDLFWGFLKVGLFSFGGAYAAIPLIRDVVLSYGWIDDEMLSYMIAVSESSPGPIMINMATYIGTSKAGFIGALVATFAVSFPTFLIILLFAAVMHKLVKNRFVEAAIGGIVPCIVGIILSTGAFMIFKNVFRKAPLSINTASLVLIAILAVIYYVCKILRKKPMSPILFITIAAILGVASYFAKIRLI